MVRARITFDRRWRWRGVGIYSRFKRLGPVDQLPECVNAADIEASIVRLSRFPRVTGLAGESWFTRWTGRFRVEVDARGRTRTVAAHAYHFGFRAMKGLTALLKKLRFQPARRNGLAVNYDFAVNVALIPPKVVTREPAASARRSRAA